MADLKISQLTAISVLTPATDVLPVVDVGGVTKKITTNQILASGGVASLASATITGAATVGTTLGVTGVSTFAAGTALLPALTTTGDTNTGIYYPAADTFAVTTGGVERYRVNASGVLLVGRTSVLSAETFSSVGFALIGGATHQAIIGEASGNVFAGSFTNTAFRIRTNNTEVAQFDATGNVGIGVVPTTIVGGSGVNGKGLQGDTWTISSQGGSNDAYFGCNIYTSAYGVWSNRVNAASGAYYISGGTHIFYRGAAQAAGTITPTESARIDASGNLILQPSSTPPSLFANGQLTVNATSDTNLRFSYRGSDGTTRVANITLA